MATVNGFKYQDDLSKLPKLSLIEERLISPRIPFIQIKRLRHFHGQFGIYGQIINVPVDVDKMVTSLPRNDDNDHCYYVHLKKRQHHKTSELQGLVSKEKIK